jgi:hypothetical protein
MLEIIPIVIREEENKHLLQEVEEDEIIGAIWSVEKIKLWDPMASQSISLGTSGTL